MRVCVQVEIVIDDDLSVRSIDQAARRGWEGFARLAWQKAVSAVEAAAVRQSGGAPGAKGHEDRRLRTSAGPARFRRRRFLCADGREEGTFSVCDLSLRPGKHQRFAPDAGETSAKLSSIAPSCAKSSRIAEILLGDAPSGWGVPGRTHKLGGASAPADSGHAPVDGRAPVIPARI